MICWAGARASSVARAGSPLEAVDLALVAGGDEQAAVAIDKQVVTASRRATPTPVPDAVGLDAVDRPLSAARRLGSRPPPPTLEGTSTTDIDVISAETDAMGVELDAGAGGVMDGRSSDGLFAAERRGVDRSVGVEPQRVHFLNGESSSTKPAPFRSMRNTRPGDSVPASRLPEASEQQAATCVVLLW